MKPKLLLLTLLLSLTLTACTPAPSEPESSSVPTSPSQVAEQSSAPESWRSPTTPDWMDAAFEQRLLDWGSGNGGTTEALLEEYGELVYSDRDLGLQLEDGVLGGWICLAPREEIPQTVQLEELYRNSARLEQFRENCQAGRPDQLVWLHEGDPLPFTLDVYTFDGTAILRESINPMWGQFESGGTVPVEFQAVDQGWQLRSPDGKRDLVVPSGPLTRARLDLEEVLRRAGEAGYTIEQSPSDQNGVPCTHYALWQNEETGPQYISFRAAEDGSCWFYSDEVNDSTRLAVKLAEPTGEPA